MNAGPSGANIALNAQGATDGGSININTTGSGTGVNFNSSSLTPTMNISNAGNVTIANNNTVGGNLIVNQNATINQNSNIVGNLNVNGIAVIGTPSTAPSILATPSPGSEYSLYVANGILTEKVKVALHSDFNWADFVFNKDYKLKPLNEVEKYVKANKHLPEVPSANEVAEDGIDVANMDSKLLQKIEELTLYVIEQQKQLEQQKNEIDQLKKKMD